MVYKGWEAVIWVLSAAAAAAVYKQHATLPWNVALKKMRTRFQLDSIYARFSLIFFLLSFQGSWNAPVQSVRSLRSQGIIAFAGIDSILSAIILTEDEVVVGHPSSSMLPPSSKLPLSYLRNPVPLPGTFHKVFKREAGVLRIMENKLEKEPLEGMRWLLGINHWLTQTEGWVTGCLLLLWFVHSHGSFRAPGFLFAVGSSYLHKEPISITPLHHSIEENQVFRENPPGSVMPYPATGFLKMSSGYPLASSHSGACAFQWRPRVVLCQDGPNSRQLVDGAMAHPAGRPELRVAWLLRSVIANAQNHALLCSHLQNNLQGSWSPDGRYWGMFPLRSHLRMGRHRSATHMPEHPHSRDQRLKPLAHPAPLQVHWTQGCPTKGGCRGKKIGSWHRQNPSAWQQNEQMPAPPLHSRAVKEKTDQILIHCFVRPVPHNLFIVSHYRNMTKALGFWATDQKDLNSNPTTTKLPQLGSWARAFTLNC